MTSTLALALGVTGVSASQADASTETAEANQINKAELANLALNNPSALNENPVHEGLITMNSLRMAIILPLIQMVRTGLGNITILDQQIQKHSAQ